MSLYIKKGYFAFNSAHTTIKGFKSLKIFYLTLLKNERFFNAQSHLLSTSVSYQLTHAKALRNALNFTLTCQNTKIDKSAESPASLQILDSYMISFKNQRQVSRHPHLSNQSISIGLFDANKNRLEGYGKKICYDGVIKEGLFRRGKIFKGKITFCDGEVWQGEFKKGDLVNGEVLLASGNRVKGTFKRGLLDSIGEIFYSNGTHLKGVFNQGSLEKIDSITYSDGTVKKGSIVKSQIKNAEGSTVKYYLHGRGKVIFSNNKIETGYFKYDQLQRGTIIWPDGKKQRIISTNHK